MANWSSYRLLTQSVLALSILTCAHPAFAQESGDLGESSSVNLSLSLSVLPTIQIETVSDISLDITDRSVDSDYTETICVKGNAGDKYSVTATGTSTESSSFYLESNAGGQLIYHVAYQEGNAASQGELTPGVPTPHFRLPSLGSDCDGISSSLTVSFKSAELMGVEAGLYTGNLTLVISPL